MNVHELLDQLPEKPPRSKLEPYRDLISQLLAKNWTYRDIAALFADKLKLAVAPSTLHNFVKVRSQQKRAYRPVHLAKAVNEKSEERLAGTGKRAPRVFEFTPGETLRLSPRRKKEK